METQTSIPSNQGVSARLTLSLVVAVICLLLFILLSIFGLRVHLGSMDGQKVGQVFGINEQGVLRKTWEAELVRGGMTNGSGAFGTKPFDFTVPSELAELVKKYSAEQTEVIIHYHQPRVYWYWNSENDGIFLENIQPAKK
jgi:hypothetical protein